MIVVLATAVMSVRADGQMTRDGVGKVERARADRGEVLIRFFPGERVVAMVDTETTDPRDGFVDQWFTLQTAATFAASDWIHLPDAEVKFREGRLRVLDHSQKVVYELAVSGYDVNASVPDGYTLIRTEGFGLSRSASPTAMRIPKARPRSISTWDEGCDVCEPLNDDPGTGAGSSGPSCDAGGKGATQCSLTTGGRSCEVTCGAGYYACCTNLSWGGVLCKCYAN